MTAYKLVRKMKDGSLAPLFINKRFRFEIGKWMIAGDHKTKGFAHRPGFHCCKRPVAPHLSEKGRVWVQVETDEDIVYNRPESQGGKWVLAQRMMVVKELTHEEARTIRNITKIVEG